MHIVVVATVVPDLVEELEVDASGTALDREWLALVPNEFGEHAVEQAILLQERQGGSVTVLAPAAEGADELLFSASAKGANRLLKLTGEAAADNHQLARQLEPIVAELAPDLVLTGVQAHDDLDGQLGPLLAEMLGWPYVGYIAGARLEKELESAFEIPPGEGNSVSRMVVGKEYPGGIVAQLAVSLPAVLGIQAAEQSPRYVAFGRLRQARQSATIEERAAAGDGPATSVTISRLYPPAQTARATMIEGDVDEAAAELMRLIGGRRLPDGEQR